MNSDFQPSRPLIALCVMVKNERQTLPRLIASVKDFVDKIIVLDTGSTDNTVSFLRAEGAEVIMSPFKDFGQSRTELMQFAKGKADWLLLMDADQTLQVPARDGYLFREQLPFTSPDITAFSLKHAGTHPYWVPRLVRGDRDWKFVGATHEYLDQSHTAEKLPDIEIVHHADGGTRSEKFARDLRLLRAEVQKDSKNARAMFYLANTYRDLGELDKAQACYELRVTMGGWDEEVFMARYEAAKISRDPLELWEAWACRPTRAEPLFILEQVYRERGEGVYAFAVEALRLKIPVPTTDVLWVDLAAYSANSFKAPAWKMIPGWWENSEEEFTKRLVALIPNGGTFTEVGTFLGRSFACFAHHEKLQGKRIYKTAVDTFKGTATEPEEAKAAEAFFDGFEPAFQKNMEQCGVSDFETFPMDSAKAASEKLDQSQDAVFLDGDHSSAAVSKDIHVWLPKIKPGGYICGHDYDRDSVRAVVDFCFKNIHVLGRCWIAQVP